MRCTTLAIALGAAIATLGAPRAGVRQDDRLVGWHHAAGDPMPTGGPSIAGG